jgi:hypothetical protein
MVSEGAGPVDHSMADDQDWDWQSERTGGAWLVQGRTWNNDEDLRSCYGVVDWLYHRMC